MTDNPFNEDGTRKETLAETFERLRAKRKPRPIPEHFFKDTDEPSVGQRDIKEPEAQEERFRLAAIKLAMMEDELISVAEKLDWPKNSIYPKLARNKEDNFHVSRLPHGGVIIISYIEGFKDLEGKNASIWFSVDPIHTEKAKEVSVDTNKLLCIGILADKPAEKLYKEMIQEELIASYIDTRYYFSHDGEYGKTIYINPPVQIPGREKLSESNDMVIYTSEMTEHDFEIAGQALTMLRKRLEPLVVTGDKTQE